MKILSSSSSHYSPLGANAYGPKCMNQLLFERSTGLLSPQRFARIQTTQRIYAIQSCSTLRFNRGEKEVTIPEHDASQSSTGSQPVASKLWAHQAGVSALAVDIENRILLSGGLDSSIRLWDLDDCPTDAKLALKPIAAISRQVFQRPIKDTVTNYPPRAASAHKFGVTHLSFYPFDSAAFLSSSYDHHLKLYATETRTVSADFDLKSIIYTHALSPIAQHVLVACATQHPAVRLVDLRSGANTHSLTGHHGALLSLAWSPTLDYILASGGVDGTVRLWDIRKSSGQLGVLDMEDSTGIAGTDGLGKSSRSRDTGKAHHGAVNGLTWTDNGYYLVSAGHDERARVWNATTGANTLASFGPTLKNGHLSSLPLIISPTASTPPGQELLFYPSERELLVFELHQGRLIRRLKVPGPNIASVRSRTGERNTKNRITGLVFRGQADGIYSAHTDGQIRAWLPKTAEDDRLEIEEEDSLKRHAQDDEDEDGRKKRQVLNDVFTDLTRQKISFG
ncbi:DNA excision repair protein [Lachnellula occidentalis]|uniref:DNA excision repair protein n=1 Tax=Lachnellula occidentalis TaxID=215460 RepID=A0A8H8S5T7_9HELO|nr:DNA excision repair protein [Lachnellula occidentalis]